MAKLKHSLLALPRTIEKAQDAEIYIKRMNGHERDQYMAALYDASLQKEKEGSKVYLPLQSLLLFLTLCDVDGKAAFDTQAEISELDSLLLDKLASQATELNGFSEAAQDDIKKN